MIESDWTRALSTSLPEEEYDALAESNDLDILAALAMNRAVSNELFQRIILIIACATDNRKVDILRMVAMFRKIDVDFVMQNFDKLPIDVVLANRCFSEEEREEIRDAYKRYQAFV
jgi:hypothetical protein